MRPYLDLLETVLTRGKRREDRTGVGTLSLFGTQTRYDLAAGFPAVTTKKLYFDSVVKELLWILRGQTNIAQLGCGIWDHWADEYGELGPIYGAQWRSWSAYTPSARARWDGSTYDLSHLDQIAAVIEGIRTDPSSRRLIVSAWNVADLPDMRLPPCHVLFQFYVDDGKLSCQLYQRSCDLAVGGPFNIASYSLLTHLIAHICGIGVGEFIHTIGDAHIYLNHVDQVREQLSREPYQPPTLLISNNVQLTLEAMGAHSFDPHAVTPADFTLANYQHHPTIKLPVAV